MHHKYANNNAPHDENFIKIDAINEVTKYIFSIEIPLFHPVHASCIQWNTLPSELCSTLDVILRYVLYFVFLV